MHETHTEKIRFIHSKYKAVQISLQFGEKVYKKIQILNFTETLLKICVKLEVFLPL